MDYTNKDLREIEDVAPQVGLDTIQELAFPGARSRSNRTGRVYRTIKPISEAGLIDKKPPRKLAAIVGGGRIDLNGTSSSSGR
jgi:hypothetical protein